MQNSYFEDESEYRGGFAPLYHGRPADESVRRDEKVESKEGKSVLNGINMSDRKVDNLATYALILGFLSIFCVLLDNGYLISMLALLIVARALNSGTRRRKTALAAVICCVLSIILYILCVAARPLLQDMAFYQKFMDTVGCYWPL